MILLIIIIGFIGRKFYELAHEYDKSRWGYAILGGASFFVGAWIGTFMIALIGDATSPGFIDRTNETALGLMGYPFGFLVCWLLYRMLDKSWSKPKELSKQTLDSDLIKPNANPYSRGEK